MGNAGVFDTETNSCHDADTCTLVVLGIEGIEFSRSEELSPRIENDVKGISCPIFVD